MKKTLILSCLLTAASAALQAAPITYNLGFTLTSGDTTPTAGSFIYDSALAVNPFSSFIVNAGGLVFDLTSSANAFTGDSFVGVCKSSQSAAGFFNGVTAAGCAPFWDYAHVGGTITQFTINVCSLASGCSDGNAQATSFVQGSGSGSSIGAITATPATATPEPGAVWLSGIGMLALAAGAWMRRKHSDALPAVDSFS